MDNEQVTDTRPLAKAGRIQSVETNTSNVAGQQAQAAPAAAEQTLQTTEQGQPEGQQQQQAQPEFSEEQMKAFFKSKFNIDYTPEMESQIKDKLNFVAPKELTEEEKKQAELAREKRALDLFIEKGGRVEEYAAIKAIANADLTELSKAEALRELKDAGFDEDAAKSILAERYYQIGLDSLEQRDEETDEEFEARKASLKKKNEFGTKKLSQKAAFNQQNAKDTLNTLAAVIADQDNQRQKEMEYAAKATEHIQKMPRKLNVELGKVNDKEIPPVSISVDDAVVAEVADIFKDPAKLKQTFYNQDGTLNYAFLGDVLVKAKQFEKGGAREIYLEAQTRNTKAFQTVFPHNSAQQLGVGTIPSKNGNSNKAASAGKVQRV